VGSDPRTSCWVGWGSVAPVILSTCRAPPIKGSLVPRVGIMETDGGDARPLIDRPRTAAPQIATSLNKYKRLCQRNFPRASLSQTGERPVGGGNVGLIRFAANIACASFSTGNETGDFQCCFWGVYAH
jgi:hypothetical protein